MTGTIPFKRFGERRIVFDRKELDLWINEQLSGNGDKLNEIIKSVEKRCPHQSKPTRGNINERAKHKGNQYFYINKADSKNKVNLKPI